MDCITATAASEVLVSEIQLDCWAAAFAEEGWSRISEAGFNPFEAKCLDAFGMREFHHMIGNPHVGNVRISKADTRCDISFVVARDLQVIDVDMGQGLNKWPLFGAARLTLCPQSSSQLRRHHLY